MRLYDGPYFLASRRLPPSMNEFFAVRLCNTLYFDHQATTPVDERVLQKMLPFFIERAGNPHSSDHNVGWNSMRSVEAAKLMIGAMIGADTDEIVFTSGATESNNLALLGVGRRAREGRRRRILISAIEHKCVLAVARVLHEQLDYQVDILPVDCAGRVSVATLHDALDEDVLIVSIMAVNNEIGTVQNIRALASEARNAGAIFYSDAAQAPLAMAMSGFANDVDLASLSAHKMYGPQGVGVLYVRRDLQSRIEPLVYGGGQQNGLRSGTLPVSLCVGMAAAAELMSSAEAEEARSRLRERRDRFIQRLHQLPWETTLNGASGNDRHPGNANICFHGFSAHDILQTLQPHLAASTGSACTTGIPEPSHVLRAIGLEGSEAEASVRFSLGFHTTDSDIDEAVCLIRKTLERIFRHR